MKINKYPKVTELDLASPELKEFRGPPPKSKMPLTFDGALLGMVEKQDKLLRDLIKIFRSKKVWVTSELYEKLKEIEKDYG